MAIKLHFSSPKRDPNASTIAKMISSPAWMKHSTNTCHHKTRLKIRRFQRHYRNWLWVPNNASKFAANGIWDFDFSYKECIALMLYFVTLSQMCRRSEMTKLQMCIVKSLEKCSESTPANLVESMFKFVRNETPCVNITVKSTTKSGASSLASSGVLAVLAIVATRLRLA